MDLTEAEDIKEVARRHRMIQKGLNAPDNHDGVIILPRATHSGVQSKMEPVLSISSFTQVDHRMSVVPPEAWMLRVCECA